MELKKHLQNVAAPNIFNPWLVYGIEHIHTGKCKRTIITTIEK
jgi:hypothetical protein